MVMRHVSASAPQSGARFRGRRFLFLAIFCLSCLVCRQSPAQQASIARAISNRPDKFPTGNPLAGSRHLPSVISYASLNEWAPPVSKGDWVWEAKHLDAAHGQDHAQGILAVDPNFYFIKYELIETAITEGKDSEVPNLIGFCKKLGSDPENAFLHYAEDTYVDLSACSGKNRTLIPGWGAGSAKTRSEARVQSCTYSLRRYVWNHGDTTCLRPYIKARTERDITSKLSGLAHIRGIFYDELGPISRCTGSGCLSALPNTVGGTGSIAEFANETKAQLIADGKYERNFTALLTEVKNELSERTNGDFLALANTAQCTDQSCIDIGLSADGVLTEFFDSEAQSYCGAGVECEWAFADKLTENHNVIVWTEGDYNTPVNPDFSACNYNSPASRHQMWALSNYWMIKSANYAWYSQRPWKDAHSNWGLLKDHWYKAQEYDIGSPTGSRYLWKSGTDASGNGFKIFRREYTKGIVLVRGRSSWSDKAPQNSRTPAYELGTTYHVLNSNGSLGPGITQIGLCRDEAVTLVP